MTSLAHLCVSPLRIRAFRAFSGLTSGVGVQYSPSAIIASSPDNSTPSATRLTIGRRLPPQIVLRAGSNQPVEIQDLCPSDTRFKILVFTGDVHTQAQSDLVKRFADQITSSFAIGKLGGKAFDFMCIIKGEKETTEYVDVPAVLRTHWTKYVSIPIHISIVIKLSYLRVFCA